MIGLLLDPDAALDAVNNAVRLVKKASATAQNIESLAPMLGKYFDAKANAIASAEAAKAGTFGGSSMGKALEIELAIDAQKEFEEDLKAPVLERQQDGRVAEDQGSGHRHGGRSRQVCGQGQGRRTAQEAKGTRGAGDGHRCHHLGCHLLRSDVGWMGIVYLLPQERVLKCVEAPQMV